MAKQTSESARLSESQVTSVMTPNDRAVLDHDMNPDEAALVALGYKQEFKREFTLWTSFSVSFSVLGILPSIASTLYYGLYAGLFGMTVGWIIASFFIVCVSYSMAELCSSMPTSGGLYYAAAVLAPPGWGPLAAWITGWSNWLSQVTGAPSVDYGAASLLLGGCSIAYPEYVPQQYQVFLVTVALLLIQGTISSMPTRYIARFNACGTIINFGFLLIVIVIVLAQANTGTSPRFNDNVTVWSTIQNSTDMPNGIAVLMSFLSVIWTLSGYDAPFHLSEESSNAAVCAPRAIVMTSTFGVTLGFVVELVIAYTITDIGGVLDSDIGQPFAAWALQVLPQQSALAIVMMTFVAAFFMGQACTIAASRVAFAYGRDGVLPFNRFLARVNRHTLTPVNAVWYDIAIGICLSFLIFGGPLAVGAIFSIGATGAYVAFTTPIFIRTFFVGNRFKKGPWNLGRLSKVMGVLACAFVALMIPILALPAVTGADLNAQTMNYTCLVYYGPMMFALIHFAVSGRKWFRGPKINVADQIYGVDPNADDSHLRTEPYPDSSSQEKKPMEV